MIVALIIVVTVVVAHRWAVSTVMTRQNKIPNFSEAGLYVCMSAGFSIYLIMCTFSVNLPFSR